NRHIAPSRRFVSTPTKQTLPDGSVVHLNTGAAISVAYTHSSRRVVLDRGEAHFQVEKSVTPFVVAAHGIEVRAVGTVFSVQLMPQAVEVLVTEGRVAVDQSASNAPLPPSLNPTPQTLTFVDAGNHVVI